LASVKVPILIILGDHDFVALEHAVESFKFIPNAELAVIPDASHFAMFFGTRESGPNSSAFPETAREENLVGI
jgi:hypothetical protein